MEGVEPGRRRADGARTGATAEVAKMLLRLRRAERAMNMVDMVDVLTILVLGQCDSEALKNCEAMW